MNKNKVKNKLFYLTVKFPAVTILIIVITLVSIFAITYTSYINVYKKHNAEINYKDGSKTTFIQLYINNKDLGQADINSEVLWYLDREGKWYKAKIVEIKNIPEKNSFYLRIEPIQEDIIKEFINKPSGVYPVNVEVLIGRERVIEKLFGGRSEGAK